MELWQLIVIIGILLICGIVFVVVMLRLSKPHNRQLRQADKTQQSKQYSSAAERDVEHIFNQEFREELRNRGRLHFEKIIGENAMFLQQDLRLTTSQLNEYMKREITKTLQEEFAKYETSIMDAKQLAIESIDKTREAIEQQRQILSDQLQKQLTEERQRHMERFDKNMAEIINHYVVAAIGDQIDLNDQLEYIIGELEANKQAIVEDIRHGA